MAQFTQWRIRGGGYCPEGEVTLRSTVPSGQYQIVGFGMGMPIGLGPMVPVKDDLVRVENTVSDVIIREIAEFQGLGEKYRQHGATHKRGFLLYGPPGTGKTCTLWQVAEESVTKFDSIVIHNSNPMQIAKVAASIRSIEPKRSIVVMMEDVDSSIGRGEEDALLDLLDGKSTVNNIVFVATTNYLSQLPPRIRNRPSRFDRVVKIGAPNEEYRRAYIASRHLSLSEKELARWIRDTNGFSLAHVKELILSTQVLGIEYREALARIRGMAEEAAREAAEAEGKPYTPPEYVDEPEMPQLEQ